MKKLKIYISVIAVTALFVGCGATNCGCGLTGDANKIQLKTDVIEQQTLVAETE